jgi:hypothetical protein
MALSDPFSLPTTGSIVRLVIEPLSNVGVSMSPLSYSQQVFVSAGEMWGGSFELGPMNRADGGEDWAGWLTSLNGREHPFLLGDPSGATPRGTWAGASPLLNGAHAAAVKTIAIDGLAAGAGGKRGDWLQSGSGSSTRLYKVALDFTANGSGQATVEIWPGLRTALVDNTPLVIQAAKGLFRLASNRRGWTIEDALFRGISVDFHEAI